MIVCVTGIAALLVGAYFTNYLFAQNTGAGAATQPQPGTKVAVINIGHVFNHYVRAEAFKKELESAFNPFKEKAKKLTDDMKIWEEEARKPGATQAVIERNTELIKRNKRELEDLSVQMQKLLGKRQEENLVTLWKEVNMGISKVAEAYGFQIVIGYGDPLEKDMMHLFPNINRKMQAMDGGAGVPLYVHASVDLSHAVTQTLNQWVQQSQQPVIPTGGKK